MGSGWRLNCSPARLSDLHFLSFLPSAARSPGLFTLKLSVLGRRPAPGLLIVSKLCKLPILTARKAPLESHLEWGWGRFACPAQVGQPRHPSLPSESFLFRASHTCCGLMRTLLSLSFDLTNLPLTSGRWLCVRLCGDELPAAQRKCKWETGRVPEPGTVSRTGGGLKIRCCGH